MIEIRRILCPIDFSDHSRRALDHAIAIARCYKSTITALHVIVRGPTVTAGSTPVVFELVPSMPVDREQVLADLTAFAATGGPAGVPIATLVREGHPAAEIVDQATSMNADLLVMGTHGRSGADRLLLGSVTEKVLRKARCPLMTVPRKLPDAVPLGPVLYRRILCPVDFSESSLHALEYAASLAQPGGQLTVLHVVAHEFEDTSDIQCDAGMTVGEFLQQCEEALERRLHRAIAGAAGLCCVDPLITHGKPWREVLRVATERQSDLIVMGVRGRGVTDLLLFGSTTHHVVREASCPVLTLRHRAEAADSASAPAARKKSS
jgi:nucleotide-binding universal stress UspA family protein